MSSRTTAIPSFGATDKLTRRAWGTLLVLCGALFLDALDVSMVGVALPSIQTTSTCRRARCSGSSSAYVLGYGGFLLLGGRAADLLGRRRVFLIALGVFVVASMLGGLANDGTLLIATRFIKGVSAAFTAPAGAVDHHDDVRGRPGAQQGAVDLHRDRRDRVLARARDRRPADRDRLALGVLPARARRAGPSCSPAAQLVPQRPHRPRTVARVRRRRRGEHDRRRCCCSSTRSSRRPSAGWFSARTLGSFLARRGDPDRVRAPRAPHADAARAARDPALGLARARQPRRHVAVRRLGRLPVHRHAVHAGPARLVGARDRARDLPRRACSSRSSRRASRR